MEAIAERGHSAMTWLLGLGLISAWAALDEPPPVVDTAYGIARRALAYPEAMGIEGDPLAELPPAVKTPLGQVRYECFRTGGGYEPQSDAVCCAALRPITVEAVLLLARETLKRSEQTAGAESRWFLTIGAMRRDLARLEAWHHKSGLSASTTVGDLQTELGSKIQVPGTEQSLDVPSCLVFVGLAIAALQAYLLSLLATAAQLPADASDKARGWVVLHRSPLGPILATLWTWLPGAAWLTAAVLLPLGKMEAHPTILDWSIAAAVGATLLPMPRMLSRVRRKHLDVAEAPAATLPLTVRQNAA